MYGGNHQQGWASSTPPPRHHPHQPPAPCDCGSWRLRRRAPTDTTRAGGWRPGAAAAPRPRAIASLTSAAAAPPLCPSPPGRPVATGTAVPWPAVSLRTCSTVVAGPHRLPSVRTHRRSPGAPQTTGHGSAGARHRRGRVSANPAPLRSSNFLVQRQTAGVCAAVVAAAVAAAVATRVRRGKPARRWAVSSPRVCDASGTRASERVVTVPPSGHFAGA